jgi:hypothetical protein
MNRCNTRPVETQFGLMDENVTVIIAVNSVRPSDSSYLMNFIKVLLIPGNELITEHVSRQYGN